MTIWVDADSCPVRVREIIAKASARIQKQTVFVANRRIPLPPFKTVTMIITSAEEQAADSYIIEHAEKNDLAVTRDIPLAKKLLEKELAVINDRGTEFTADNINSLLSARNFSYELSANGLYPERTDSFGKREIQKFSSLFDSILTKLLKKQPLK